MLDIPLGALGVARRFVNFDRRNNLFIEPIVADIVPGLKEIELTLEKNIKLSVSSKLSNRQKIEKQKISQVFVRFFRKYIVVLK